jgi:hypothetical protein
VNRSAPLGFDRVKAACVCQDGSPNHGLAGFVHRATREVDVGGGSLSEALDVTCLVAAFDAGGGLNVLICRTFEVLPR